MGLLDDAIREHLELKRRRGADASEVAQQEHEALGPVPRGAGGRALPAEEAPPEEPPAFDDAPPSAAPEVPAAASPLPEPVVEAPPVEDEIEYELDLPDADDEDPFVPVDETPPTRVEEPAPPVDQPTQAYSLSDLDALDDRPRAAPPQDVVPADDEPGEHDVLEDTPDFLEETPEHDRLWFEQKPPKDFDF